MNNRLLISVAAAALIAGTGLATAQNPGASREAPAAGATKSAPSAPAADRAAPAAAPTNKDEATEPKRDNGAQRATDSSRDGAAQKSGTASSDKSDPSKAGKDMKAEGRSATDPKAADTKSTSTETKSTTTTTGQAGAAGKLSTEQRTKITTVIKEQKVQPVTNVNFSISVGTRVPREVRFHPLPAEIVTVYPDWRGYDFILVNNQILVINPRTYEIVAVLDA